jgi:DNA-binding transcriptional LysR family regulator
VRSPWTQPAISEAVANLEHVLRVQLLDRSPRGVTPTIYADTILKRSATVFDELKQGVRDIEFLSDPTAGKLAIGYTDMVAALLPDIVAQCSERLPRVALELDLVQSPIMKSLPRLHDRTYDLILGRPPLLDDPSMENIATESLFEDPMVVVAGIQSPWSRRRKVNLAKLANERWILSPPNGWTYELVAATFKARGLGIPKDLLVTNSLDLRTKLLRSGRFITLVPTSALCRDDRHELKALPIELPAWSWPVTIFTLKNRTLSPVVERFMDCARGVAKSRIVNSRRVAAKS